MSTPRKLTNWRILSPTLGGEIKDEIEGKVPKSKRDQPMGVQYIGLSHIKSLVTNIGF